MEWEEKYSYLSNRIKKPLLSRGLDLIERSRKTLVNIFSLERERCFNQGSLNIIIVITIYVISLDRE